MSIYPDPAGQARNSACFFTSGMDKSVSGMDRG